MDAKIKVIEPGSCSSLDTSSSSSGDIGVDGNVNTNDDSSAEKRDDGLTSPDKWLLGNVGSRNSSLVFRSSALADTSSASIQSKPGFKLHVTYKVLQAESKLLSKLLDCHGVSEATAQSADYNLLWTGSHLKPDVLRSLGPHQRVNHFPRSYELTRKDRLYKNIELMQHAKGFKHFDFVPQTFVMPTEYRELCSSHFRVKGPWIVKPVASSRGRGIFIVESPNQVPLDEPVVVAKYIAHPLVVNGHKCDLRLYVAVTSFDPLLIYIYEEGLVRFATVKYDSSHKQLWNPCMHLCNYSINKYHSDYVKSEDPSVENFGHKWTLSALLRYLKERGEDTGLLMSQIEDLVVKAIISSANSIVAACKMFVPHMNNCFELYGFDILIDHELKPWLLEVNLSPSLGCDSPLDVRLKSAMLADLLTLVGLPAVDPLIRATPSNSSTTSKRSSNSLKQKIGSCRRICSADGLSSMQLNRYGRRNQTSTATLTPEEIRLLRYVKTQFHRRGGFVRIFPCVDSWSKYSQYLDPINGVPSASSSSTIYQSASPHNYNFLVCTHLFPHVPATDRNHCRPLSMDRSKQDTTTDVTVGSQRQTRYERMLRQGHCTSLPGTQQEVKESRCGEIQKQICDMLKSGKRLTQNQARRTFSHYLACILKRIAAHTPEQDGHVELVLRFLQKATNYLQSSFVVKPPSHKLSGKDRAAIVAKQLNDFLFVYNRETEIYSNTLERTNGISNKLIADFLDTAREGDLEEVLTLQTMQDNLPLQSTQSQKFIKKKVDGTTIAIPLVGTSQLLKTLPIETAPGTKCLKKPINARKKIAEHNAAKSNS